MWWKEILILLSLASLLAAGGCLEIPEHSVCASGLICPPGLQCAATQDICIAGLCGNRIVDDRAGETCDDGDVLSGDGCSQECISEAPYPSYSELALGGSPTCALSENSFYYFAAPPRFVLWLPRSRARETQPPAERLRSRTSWEGASDGPTGPERPAGGSLGARHDRSASG